jgi:hypothetical protein
MLPSFAMLKLILNKIGKCLKKARDAGGGEGYASVRYTSVPIWRPWRDF